MSILVIGLILFLGIHSIRIVSDATRTRLIEQYSLNTFKLTYTVVSFLGLALIVYGYGQTRIDPVFLWHPPVFTRHLAFALVAIAFIVLAATYVPNNAIKLRLGHPMYASIKIWAFAHLLANGRLGDVVLFGAFLVWAVIGFVSCRRRDRLMQAGKQNAQASVSSSMPATLMTIVIGLVAYIVFAIWLHKMLIGVSIVG
jgi:uncharacterized membrane protein